MPLQSSQLSSPEARYHLIRFVIMTRMQVSANASEFDAAPARLAQTVPVWTVLSVNACTSKHENRMYSLLHET